MAQRPAGVSPPGGTAVMRPATAAAAAKLAEEKKCPKCGEKWTPKDLVCWKCGTQNPDAVARKQLRQEQSTASEILDIASKLDPSKKKKWWKPGG